MANIRRRNATWQVQIRKQGHNPLSKSFSSKKDAEQWAKQIEADMGRGVFLDISEAQQTALSQALARYASEVLPGKRSTKVDLSRAKHLKFHLGNYSLSAVTPSVVSQYRDTRLKRVSPQSVVHEVGLLSRVLNTCMKDWGIHLPHGNPVSQVRKPRLPQGRDRRLNGDEESRLLSELSRDLQEERLVMLFALETAMRRGEIARIRWEHVNMKTRTLLIPETKTDTPRTVPLSSQAVAVLQSLPRRIDGQVWNMTADRITRAFIRACRRAGIENLRFHDLRHEATSRLFEKGLNLMEVASITGHKDLRMLKRYTHLRAEDLVEKLG